jgi:formamidopyrimidine-DNA glycosylase
MPELPEVETIRVGLASTTRNRSIERCEVLLPRTIAFPDSPVLFCANIKQQTIGNWHRRGKYLYCELSRGYLVIHLRMTGQLKWNCQDQPPSNHTRVRFWCDDNTELRFDDQRTFGQIWWVPPDRSLTEVVTGLATLGVEPLGEEFTIDYLTEKLKDKKQPIKNALLDQRIIAGIGNIYADESLFFAGLHPLRSCHSLADKEVARLHKSIVYVLQEGLKYGGTTFSSYLDSNGSRGNYLSVAAVFRRTGQECRVCGQKIDRIKIAGRSSHFCRVCQPQSTIES